MTCIWAAAVGAGGVTARLTLSAAATPPPEGDAVGLASDGVTGGVREEGGDTTKYGGVDGGVVDSDMKEAGLLEITLVAAELETERVALERDLGLNSIGCIGGDIECIGGDIECIGGDIAAACSIAACLMAACCSFAACSMAAACSIAACSMAAACSLAACSIAAACSMAS